MMDHMLRRRLMDFAARRDIPVIRKRISVALLQEHPLATSDL
jgi:hypothetical protein